jgi:hypothetical protein
MSAYCFLLNLRNRDETSVGPQGSFMRGRSQVPLILTVTSRLALALYALNLSHAIYTVAMKSASVLGIVGVYQTCQECSKTVSQETSRADIATLTLVEGTVTDHHLLLLVAPSQALRLKIVFPQLIKRR